MQTAIPTPTLLPSPTRPSGWLQRRWRLLRGWLPVIGLSLILLLAAYLRFYELGSTGLGNQYYAATVQSMLTSWDNFFYAAYEPGGSVTVDKPPLGFWLQAISAVFLGVSGFSLALPQAMAGWLSVPLLFYLVKRHFGPAAGLLAALVLAITPVTVSTERNNTIDGTLVFVLLLAAWAFIAATETGRLRLLWLGALLVGLGFNIKMMQAFLPLPAFYTLYLAGAPGKWWRKGVHLCLATLILLAVSLSWATIVDLTPASERPYIGSSQNNTVMELIIGHNGLSRLLPGGSAGVTRLLNGEETTPAAPVQPAFAPNGAIRPVAGPMSAGQGRPGGGMTGEIGQPGLLRLLTEPLVTEAGWLLPLALLGLLVAVWQLGLPRPFSQQHLALLLWGGWLLTEVAFFNVASLFHAYYLIMLGPPLAALVAVAGWAIWRTFRQRAWLGWLLLLLGAAVTLAFQLVTLLPYPQQGLWLVPAALTLLVAGLLGLLLTFYGRLEIGDWTGNLQSPISNLQKSFMGLTLSAVLLAPATWAGLTALNSQPNLMLPRSGPASANAALPGLPPAATGSQEANGQFQLLVDYLEPRTADTTYMVATLSSMEASPFILATSRPVLTFGGFSGGDPVIDAAGLADLVANGEVGYVLDNGSLQQRKPDIYNWLQSNCHPVPDLPGLSPQQPPTNNPTPPNDRRPNQLRLFDCT